jgi:hypothetical protein
MVTDFSDKIGDTFGVVHLFYTSLLLAEKRAGAIYDVVVFTHSLQITFFAKIYNYTKTYQSGRSKIFLIDQSDVTPFMM